MKNLTCLCLEKLIQSLHPKLKQIRLKTSEERVLNIIKKLVAIVIKGHVYFWFVYQNNIGRKNIFWLINNFLLGHFYSFSFYLLGQQLHENDQSTCRLNDGYLHHWIYTSFCGFSFFKLLLRFRKNDDLWDNGILIMILRGSQRLRGYWE